MLGARAEALQLNLRSAPQAHGRRICAGVIRWGCKAPASGPAPLLRAVGAALTALSARLRSKGAASDLVLRSQSPRN